MAPRAGLDDDDILPQRIRAPADVGTDDLTVFIEVIDIALEKENRQPAGLRPGSVVTTGPATGDGHG